MAHTLRRSLGLTSTLAVSIGAMLGSGIFVLPGLAAGKAGPAAALAYVVAGLVVLPAALSKAEMSTAMPEAGGTYLFIDKSMGPMLGTIAGFGVWFSLIFKASFALAGLGEYLFIFGHVPARPVALGVAVLLTGLNLAGTSITGRAQAGIVVVVLVGLAVFIPAAFGGIHPGHLTPFIPNGNRSVLAAAALVFVSFAGVTKIAGIAEEVKNPGRNLPLGMLLPLGLMAILYPLATLGMVGVVGADGLSATTTPIADVAGVLGGDWGLYAMAGLAVLALVSMANAGVLASSRYPFAWPATASLLRRSPRSAGVPTRPSCRSWSAGAS